MKGKLKIIWDKVKKPFNWHVYPTTKDLRIKSFIEFGFYLFITAGLICLFLAHPRQIGGLGSHSSEWYDAHQEWENRNAV